MLLKSVFIGFLSFHSVDTTMLKECENHADKISGCVEKYKMEGNTIKNGGRHKKSIMKWESLE